MGCCEPPWGSELSGRTARDGPGSVGSAQARCHGEAPQKQACSSCVCPPPSGGFQLTGGSLLSLQRLIILKNLLQALGRELFYRTQSST